MVRTRHCCRRNIRPAAVIVMPTVGILAGPGISAAIPRPLVANSIVHLDPGKLGPGTNVINGPPHEDHGAFKLKFLGCVWPEARLLWTRTDILDRSAIFPVGIEVVVYVEKIRAEGLLIPHFDVEFCAPHAFQAQITDLRDILLPTLLRLGCGGGCFCIRWLVPTLELHS